MAPHLPRVVLIGDSIRLGYQDTVACELQGIAEVWSPDENGENSRNVLAHLDTWVIARRPDLVHINCGLHDINREPDCSSPIVALEEYTANVAQILAGALRTGATVIWATTTPVEERRHLAVKGFVRLEADVVRYNAAATSAAAERGVALNDLYAAVLEAGPENLLGPDGVHYDNEGYEYLGRRVAQAIRLRLAGRP